MGQRFRLRPDFDVSGFDPEVQVILRALKKFGMMLADNGSPWFLSGVPDERWDNEVLSQLRAVKGKDFEAVDVSSLMVGADSGRVAVQTIKFFSQLLDGRSGNVRFFSNLFFMNSGARSAVTVEFFDSSGNPWSLEFGDLGNGSQFTFWLKNGESRSMQTEGPTTPQVGYARVSLIEGITAMAVVIGMDIPSRVVFYEAGIPPIAPLTQFSIFLDSSEKKNTGLALVNPPADSETSSQEAEARIMVRLYDTSASLIGQELIGPFAPGHHVPRFIHQLFTDPELIEKAQEMVGTVTFESDRPVAAVTLRQNDGPARDFQSEVPVFTTFPVVPGNLVSAQQE
jgi:hypothetical protein